MKLNYVRVWGTKINLRNFVKFIKLWVPVILWAALIFYLSSLPDLKTDLKYDFFLRKIAHMLEYLILTFLLFRAIKGSFDLTELFLFIYPASLALFYAVSDEFHQLFVRGRDGSIMDVLIDAAGILSFFILSKVFCLIRKWKALKGAI